MTALIVLLGIVVWVLSGLTVGAYTDVHRYEQWRRQHIARWPSLAPENYAHEYATIRSERLFFHALGGPITVVVYGFRQYAAWVMGRGRRRVERRRQQAALEAEHDREVRAIMEYL